MAWNKMDVEVGKYLRKHGYIEERKLQKQNNSRRKAILGDVYSKNSKSS